MQKEIKFFVCSECGSVAEIINPSENGFFCCENKMTELVPNSTETSADKHMPVLRVLLKTAKVTVGEKLHPMLTEHYIDWIIIVTSEGSYRKNLLPGDLPIVKFKLNKDENILAVYSHCNTHGLWKSK